MEYSILNKYLSVCIPLVSAFGRISNVIYTELPTNHILSQNTTLYCITENSTPWSYLDLAGNVTVLNTTFINAAIGLATLSVTTDNPGYYSCQVIQSGGLDETYTVGIFSNPSYTCKLKQYLTTGVASNLWLGVLWRYFTSYFYQILSERIFKT